jgi:hypothetical protein
MNKLELNPIWRARQDDMEHARSLFAQLPDCELEVYRSWYEPALEPECYGDAVYQNSIRKVYQRGFHWTDAALVAADIIVSGWPTIHFLPRSQTALSGVCLNSKPGIELSTAQTEYAGAAFNHGFSGDTYFVGGHGFAIYGHWLLDFLPRLLLASDIANTRGRDFRIIVPSVEPYAREMLARINLLQHCTFLQPGEIIRLQGVTIPLGARINEVYAATYVGRSFTALAADRDHPPQPPTGKLLIGRRKPPVARNFAWLEQRLTQMGFSTFYPEDHSLDVQIDTFMNAAVVVSEDGSAAHNTGFCQPGARVIIASRGDRLNPWHASVARFAQQRLSYVLSTQLEDNNYTLPVEKIIKLAG